MSDLMVQDWYQTLLDDIKSTIVEFEFQSRWALIEGYHKVGQELRSVKADIPITELVHKCAVDMAVSERKLWYAVKFFDKFPDLELLPEGKDISFSRIKSKYLTDSKTKIEEMFPVYDDAVIMMVLANKGYELIKSAQFTKDGVVIFIPNDLLKSS